MKNAPEIILASASAGRKAILDSAGVHYTALPADIDEHALITSQTSTPIKIITQNLANAKALHIAAKNTDALVIGSDQTLEFEGQILSKATSPIDAAAKLKNLRGKTHHLHSAVCVAQHDNILFEHTSSATLHMRHFDDNFLESYMARDPDALMSCVGAYKIEGVGAHLFSAIEGDNFTIMGMPLLPLLGFLQNTYGIKP